MFLPQPLAGRLQSLDRNDAPAVQPDEHELYRETDQQDDGAADLESGYGDLEHVEEELAEHDEQEQDRRCRQRGAERDAADLCGIGAG